MKPPTANEIDRACQAGFFCFVGNRQQVDGARKRRTLDPERPGYLWVSMRDDLTWRYVSASEVVITNETFNGGKQMAKGKRAAGSPSHVTVRASKTKVTQPALPGVEQEKMPALERLAKSYKELKAPFADARNALTEAKETLVKMAHQKLKPNDAGELVYKRGDVKILIKPAKESVTVTIGEDDDEEEGSEE